MDTCPKSHEKFVDFDTCLSIIEDLQTKLDPIGGQEEKCKNEAEKIVETFRKTVDPYQERPELLEPYLADLIQKLTVGLSDVNISSTRYHTIFKLLYLLTKITGFKTIGKKFPHETDKLPFLIELLSVEDPKDKLNWQTRFVLTVWLSIVILTPFDLEKFDTSSTDKSISERIYSILMRSLELHDSCQHVTAFCLAKFFSRPDVLKDNQQLAKFISDALDELANVKKGLANSVDDIRLIGYLRTLTYMFKFLPRAEMKSRCETILAVALKLDIEAINRELVNHLIIKLIQRAGLAFLPKRVATWRYKRGCRILGYAPADQTSKPASGQVAEEGQQPEEDEMISNEDQVRSSEHLEAIFSVLFVAAQNSQTRIRWSAAKGIARLASRLNREHAGDVMDMMMGNFFDLVSSSEFAWHGGCLTLAEMSRNGLILEEKLASVNRIVGDAILYDKIKGSFAIGAHVREAACYVCWAMARTYEDHLLKPYISSISIKLLCTMLFDRELQCRRAAAATFQELVGRQGTFTEEGIGILTNVDYHNVGQRQVAYLQLALQVASYDKVKYARPFVEHLLEKKIGHWDVQIRRLACDSLSALMLHSDQEFVSKQVIRQLMSMGEQDSDNNAKHGAILGLAKTIRGLVPLQFEFSSELIEFVGGIVQKCAKQLKSKQLGANFMEAIGHIISSAEVASFQYADNSDTLKQWESISLDALNSDKADLRDIGSEALLTLYRTYYKADKTSQDRLLTHLNLTLSSPNESSRCGALKALSKLSKTISGAGCQMIKTDADTPDIILTSLTLYIAKDTREEEQDLVFAQAKAEACEAFANFVQDLDKSLLIPARKYIEPGYDALLAKTEDYTLDRRGDIGVVVRRASVKALTDLTLYMLSIGFTSPLDSIRVRNIICRVLQQSVSYNNSARELAATCFYKLIGSELPDEFIPHKSDIVKLFQDHGVDDQYNWRDDSTPIFVSLLSKPEYRRDLWIGLLPAVGQVSDLCAKQFRDALSNFIQSLSSQSPDESQRVFESLLETLQQKNIADRLVTSGLVAVDYMLTQGLMNDISGQLQEQLCKFCWTFHRSGDPKRLMAVSRVLCSMLQFTGPVQRKALNYCLIMLGNGLAKVRVSTAEQLYLSIMTYQSDLEENLAVSRQVGDLKRADESEDKDSSDANELDLGSAMDLLCGTNWSEPLSKIGPVKDKICALMNVSLLELKV